MSCVYVLNLPYTKEVYPNRVVVKIGFTSNIQRRLKEFATIFERAKRPTYMFGINGTEFNTKKGLRILERLFHYYLRMYRLDKTCELFDLTSIPDAISYVINLLNNGGHDLSTFESEIDLPTVQDSPVIKYETNESLYEPFDYQRPVIDKIIEHYKDHNTGYIFCPPGYGKTYITGFSLKQLSYKSVLIVTPQIMICMEFAKMFDNLNIKYEHIMESDQIDDVKESIIIMTYSMYKQIGHKIKPDFAIFDEAHHIQEMNSWSDVTKLDCKKLLLTATPKIANRKPIKNDDGDGDGDGDELSLVFDNNDVIYRSYIDDDIEKGILCPIKLFIYDGYDELIHELLYTYDRKYVVMFFNTRKSAQDAMQQFRSYLDENPIEDFKVDMVYIDGQTPQNIRDQILFKPNDVNMKIVFNVNIIGEGVSVREIDAVCFMESRKSSIGLMQNIGRAMRVYPNKEDAMIILPSSQEIEIEAVMKSLYHSGCRKLTIKSTGPTPTNIQTKYADIWNTYCNIRQVKSWDQWYDLCLDYEKTTTESIVTKTKYKNSNIGRWLYEQKCTTPDTYEKLIRLNSWKKLSTYKFDKIKANLTSCYIRFVYDNYECIGIYNDELHVVVSNNNVYDLNNFCVCVDLLEYYDDQWLPISNMFTKKKKTFDEWYDLCVDYENQSVIHAGSHYRNSAIGKWLYERILPAYKNNELSADQITQLEKLQSWPIIIARFENWINACLEWETVNNDTIKTETIYKDYKIGSWLRSRITHAYKNNKLSDDQISLLKQLNTWSLITSKVTPKGFSIKYTFEQKVQLCVDYEQTGAISQSTVYENVKIGSFLNTQVHNYRQNKLSTDKIQLLNQVKRFVELSQKEIANLSFEQKVQLCTEYERIGDIIRSTIYKNVKIGLILHEQIRRYRQNKLSTDRIQLLNQVKRFVKLTRKS
jgi:superfamily II DNA or RNA helicase